MTLKEEKSALLFFFWALYIVLNFHWSIMFLPILFFWEKNKLWHISNTVVSIESGLIYFYTIHGVCLKTHKIQIVSLEKRLTSFCIICEICFKTYYHHISKPGKGGLFIHLIFIKSVLQDISTTLFSVESFFSFFLYYIWNLV